MDQKIVYQSVEAYMQQFPEETQRLLRELRAIIREAVPEAEEGIGYQMPAYKFYGALVYFAGYKKHIGFYPASNAVAVFQERLTAYKTSKGAIQFPLNQALPIALIKEIIAFRVRENMERAEKKKKK